MILLMIHGTFAKKAPWTRADSAFCKGFSEGFKELEFWPIDWDGGNSFSSRQDAKESITHTLNAAGDRIEKIVVCGHSHGGSVVSYVLKERPDFAHRIAGAVFLSTPFFVFRLLPYWRTLVTGLYVPLVILGIFIAGVLLSGAPGPVLERAFRFFSYPHAPFEAYALANAIIAGFLLWILIWLNRIGLIFEHSVLRGALNVIRNCSCELPPDTRALFVRLSGDEATSALSFVQSMAWLVIAINRFYAAIFRTISTPFRVRRIKNIYAVIIIIAGWSYIHSWFFLEFEYQARAQPDSFIGSAYLNVFWDTLLFGLRESQWLSTLFALYVAGILAACVIIPVIAILLFAISGIMFVINWLMILPLGRVPLIVGGVLQVAVEATPPGQWQVLHSSWSENRTKGEKLFWRHSRSYTDPTLINQIIEWIALQRKMRFSTEGRSEGTKSPTLAFPESSPAQ